MKLAALFSGTLWAELK